jgi:hypothetical protein
MTDWESYHRSTRGRAPRPSFERVLPILGTEPGRRAIELGFGDGTEVRALLGLGWRVLAVDAERSAGENLRADLTPGDLARLEVVIGPLEDVSLPRADLVFASYSLPFCPPDRFDALWARVTAALEPGGIFAGELFGERDSWSGDPSMTFVSRARLDELLSGFTVLHLDEEDAPGDSFMGPKHWHVFHVIAVHRAPDGKSSPLHPRVG